MEFRTRIPFVNLLGFELLKFEAATCEIAIDCREELCNSWGVAHGGMLMTLLDVTMAHAARAPVERGGEPHPGVVTIEMKTTFMRPGVGHLVARGRVLHRTASLAFCEADIASADGKPVAHATGTFKFMRALPVGDGGRKIRKLNASD